MTDDLETIGVQEAARLLRMSAGTVMRRARAGLIPGARIGRQWVFIKADLLDTIRQSYRKPVVVDMRGIRFPGNKGESDLAAEIAGKLRAQRVMKAERERAGSRQRSAPPSRRQKRRNASGLHSGACS